MKTYSINEISKLFDVQSSTLRYYEDMGLLENVGRTKTNQRIYTDEHISRLNAISCFKNTGLPISKMQDFFRYEKDLSNNIEDIIQLVTEHEKILTNRLKKCKMNLLILNTRSDIIMESSRLLKLISLGLAGRIITNKI